MSLDICCYIFWVAFFPCCVRALWESITQLRNVTCHMESFTRHRWMYDASLPACIDWWY